MRRVLTLGTTLAIAFTISACGGGGGGGGGGSASGDASGDTADAADTSGADAPTATRPPRTQPPVTIPEVIDSKVLLELIPKARDLDPLELGIPTVAAIRSMAGEVGTESTGPCGTAIPLPPLDAAAGRTYATVKGPLMAVGLPRDAAVDTFLEANKADLVAGCPAFAVTGPDGSEQTLSTPEAVDVTATTPDGLAWFSNVETPADGGSVVRLLLPSPELAVLVTMHSNEPVDAAYVQQMADVYFGKIATAV